tara:strand:+ start:593 stop:1294 length:702 start_codon:yes stop_codon:yes gene_type:complete
VQAIFLEDEDRVNAFINSVSKPRLSKYLQESGGKNALALQLYHWNAKLSQSLYLPLQSWEIVLRNRMNEFFIYKYNDKWPTNAQANRNFAGNDRNRLSETINRLTRAAGTQPTTDQIVADLSAGFWVSQFGRNYEAQYGWRNNLKYRIFVNDHSIDRQTADEICNDLLDLRNRVAHHEPIFHLPLDNWRSDLDFILRAMCPSTADYMASACSFKDVWNEKPGIQILLGEVPAE